MSDKLAESLGTR